MTKLNRSRAPTILPLLLLLLLILSSIFAAVGDGAPYQAQRVDLERIADRRGCSFRCPVKDKPATDATSTKLAQSVFGRSLCTREQGEALLNFVFAFEARGGMSDELKAHLLQKHAAWVKNDGADPNDAKPLVVLSGGYGTGKSRLAEIVSLLFSYRWREDMRVGDALVEFKCAAHQAKTPQAVRAAFLDAVDQRARAIGTRLPFVILLDDLHVLSRAQVDTAFAPLLDRDKYYGDAAKREKPFSDAANDLLPRAFVIATVDFGADIESETVPAAEAAAQQRRTLGPEELRDRTHRLFQRRYGPHAASRAAIYPLQSFDRHGHRRALQHKLYTLPCTHVQRESIRCFYWTKHAEWKLEDACANPRVHAASALEDGGGSDDAVEINGRLTDNVFRRMVVERLRMRIAEALQRRASGGTAQRPSSARVRPGQPSAAVRAGAAIGRDDARTTLEAEFRQLRDGKEGAEQRELEAKHLTFAEMLFGKKRDDFDVMMYVNESDNTIDFLVQDELLGCRTPEDGASTDL